MPRYDFRCRTCGAVFEEQRPMIDADAPATCPAGHVGAARLLPVFATTGRADGAGPGVAGAGGVPMPGGGCGAGCGCRAG